MNNGKNKLGLWMLIALVTGNMVGSGAFLLPADIARIGSIGLVALGFTSLGAISLALVFSKMSLLIPKSGGPYAYAKAGFGEYMGFQTAYYYWLSVLIGNAAIVVATLGYLGVFIPVLEQGWVKAGTILAIIWSLTIVNLLGIRCAGLFQIITSILKFTPLLVVGILGWGYFHPEYLYQHFNVTNHSNFSAFSSATILTLWLFVGVESAVVPADAVANPQRNIPLATIIGTAGAAIIYLVCNTAILGMLPHDTLINSTAPFATASEIIFGTWGKTAVALGAIVACLGALNGWILLAAQLSKAVALDGLFPKIFARDNSAEVPVYGLLITALGISALVLASTYLDLIAQFDLLVLAATTAEVLAYFYTAVAEMILLPSQGQPARHRGWHLSIAVIAAAYSIYAILSASPKIIYAITAFLLFTLPLYALFKRRTQSQTLHQASS